MTRVTVFFLQFPYPFKIDSADVPTSSLSTSIFLSAPLRFIDYLKIFKNFTPLLAVRII